MRTSIIRITVLLLFAPVGCVCAPRIVWKEFRTVYMVEEGEKAFIRRFAPAFLIYNHHETHNRIGQPAARINYEGDEEIYVNHEKPAFYYMTRTFSTGKESYTNLIYRIHFSEIPLSLIPFYLTAGKNMGIIVVLTLDKRQRPLLVTTVGTCGCYVSIFPTAYLPQEAYPDGWKKDVPQSVYGEKLPSLLELRKLRKPKLSIHIRPDVHRVMHLEFVEDEQFRNHAVYRIIKSQMREMYELEKISLNGKKTSFYYNYWPLKGHVKGSVKPWETLFLSLISLDLFVGADKVYSDSRVTGNPFYTSLKPWNREASDMWEFPRFLKFYGWQLK